ncbi:hypothetical protein SK128_018625 [Halocaridina rubra]|uniref:Uncharacterized protein n=1 Tax=Halocaridina rubra TaxID=373956 RepID=A0AAN8ZT65_HALRR
MSVMLALALTSALSYAQYPSHHSPPHYGHQPVYKEHARPYSYSYAVDDDYKGLYFSAGEASDGKSVKPINLRDSDIFYI